MIRSTANLFLIVSSSHALVGSLPTTSAGIFFAFFSAAFLTSCWSFVAYSRSSAALSRWRSRTWKNGQRCQSNVAPGDGIFPCTPDSQANQQWWGRTPAEVSTQA